MRSSGSSESFQSILAAIKTTANNDDDLIRSSRSHNPHLVKAQAAKDYELIAKMRLLSERVKTEATGKDLSFFVISVLFLGQKHDKLSLRPSFRVKTYVNREFSVPPIMQPKIWKSSWDVQRSLEPLRCCPCRGAVGSFYNKMITKGW
jgi:hypothetical protein